MTNRKKLRTLEYLTSSCLNEEPAFPLADVPSVRHMFNDFVQNYALSGKEQKHFWTRIAHIQDFLEQEIITKWDAAKMLYFVHQTLWGYNTAAHAKKEGSIESSYRPVKQLLEITSLVSRTLAEAEDRDAKYAQLYEACEISPHDEHNGFDHPMAFTSGIAKVLYTF